eukprot:s5937_g1.t1
MLKEEDGLRNLTARANGGRGPKTACASPETTPWGCRPVLSTRPGRRGFSATAKPQLKAGRFRRRAPGGSLRRQENIQDHAFCFECGIFFYAGNGQSPQCSQCGSSFVQFLRATQDSNWITTDNPIAQGFSFDDQLENSISASLAETPIPKKPTQKSFLASLKLSQLDKVEVESRSRLDASDPRSNCAICVDLGAFEVSVTISQQTGSNSKGQCKILDATHGRDSFVVGDSVYKLPCNHTFHAGCILLWLKGNNTCPICRLQLPEAVDGEDEPEILGSKNPAHDAAAESDEGESSDKEARPLTPPASEAPRGNDAAAEASASDEETSTDVVIKDVSGEPSAGQRGHSPCNLPGALEDDDADQPDLQGSSTTL